MNDSSAKLAAAPAGTAPLKLEDFLPYRLNVVASLTSQALSRIYADRYGIGVPEWRVLVTLGQYGMMTGKAIGAHSHMHKTKVSRAVAVLEKRKAARAADQPRGFAGVLAVAHAGRLVDLPGSCADCACDFAHRLTDAIEPADRVAFERAVDRLTERSATLAAEITNGSRKDRKISSP